LNFYLNPWQPADSGFDFNNADGNHYDVNSLAPYSGHNASLDQSLVGIIGATATQDQHIHSWSPNLSPSNYGSQQQAISTAYDGWHSDVTIAPSAWDPASQGFAQNLSYVTPSFDQRFIPALGSINYPSVHFTASANFQPGPNPQLPDFGVHNYFRVVDNGSTSFNSITQQVDFTDPQGIMTNFNELVFPTTATTPALSTDTTDMLTAPELPRSTARRVASRHPNGNANLYTCNHLGCGKIFTRPSDLARHGQQHGVPQHPCLVQGCNRRGLRAFPRADKLRDHQRKKHRMAI